MTAFPFSVRARMMVALAVVVVTVISCGPDLAQWFGSWGESGATLEDSTTLAYPVVASAAAWISSAPRRRNFTALLATSVRPPFVLYRNAVLWIGGCAVIGSSLVGLGVYVLTATEATYAAPSFLVLLTISCGMFTAAALGVLAGVVLPAFLGPVAALVVAYAVEVLADPSNPSIAPVAGLVVASSRDRTMMQTADWVLLNRSAWLVAVALVLVVLATRRPSVWLLPFAAACLLAVPMLIVGDDGIVVDPRASRLICTHHKGAVAVCLSAARSHASDEVWQAIRPELTLLDGLNPGRVRLIEEGVTPDVTTTLVRSGTLEVPFTIPNGATGNAHQVSPVQLQLDLASRILTTNCGPVGSDSPSMRPEARVNDVLMLWLLKELDLPTDGGPGFGGPVVAEEYLDYSGVQAFQDSWASASVTEQTAWLAQQREQIIACDEPVPPRVLP